MNEKKNYILITKDAMCTDYLPCYGNIFWKTPNIDELAARGTVFRNYYCAAPSSTMAMYSMITGVFAHETKYEKYEKINDIYIGDTAFTRLKEKGYECHLIWDELWNPTPEYFNCYRDDIIIHSLHKFRQGVGAHYKHDGVLKPDKEKEDYTFNMIEETIKSILSSKKKVFVWIHFPHVIYGRVAYGSDIELFDRYVGMLRKYFDDDAISISADHGNMNGHKNKLCYGFDVYQPAARIPLITPRIDGLEEYNENASACDLYSMIFGTLVNREYVYCDTQYCAQKKRRLAIIYKNYKYIYNKDTRTEELYDLDYDPTEEFNLISDFCYDADRKITVPSRELYYYPHWDELVEIREKMRLEKNRIWKEGKFLLNIESSVKTLIRPFYYRIARKRKS